MQPENRHSDNIEEAGIWLSEYTKTQDKNIKKKLRDLIVLAYMPLVKKSQEALRGVRLTRLKILHRWVHSDLLRQLTFLSLKLVQTLKHTQHI